MEATRLRPVAGEAISVVKVRLEYDRIAPVYALLAAIGFPVRASLYRRILPQLGLRAGDAVLDLCCGTGLNFPHLMPYIGPTGRLVGLDLTPNMLDKARRRVEKKGWTNVSLVCKNAEEVQTVVHERFDAVFCSLAFCLVPNKETVLRALQALLKPGGRLMIVDAKPFSGWARILNPIYRLFMSFASSNLVLFRERGWEIVQRVFPGCHYEEYYSGCTYVALARAGEALT